ncbi:MAG: metallopeptidase, partial [Burkholderiaceae bacterium]|nr:metallopeptidase [Burkholderiaceae bacterium]
PGAGPGAGGGGDFSLPGAVLTLQRGALDALMSDALAGRLADAESKVADPRQLLTYAEVQDRLAKAVWSELADGGRGGEIDALRRNLQREHLRRLAGGLVRPAPATAADVRAVHRQAALRLQAQLSAAVAARRGNGLVQAHLEESLATLSEALKAPLVKQGV